MQFSIYPLQGRSSPEIVCEAPIADERVVTDSGGHREKRIVIRTELLAGGLRLPIDVTITRRDAMRFRMLLGRTALAGHFLVDSRASYILGRDLRHSYQQ